MRATVLQYCFCFATHSATHISFEFLRLPPCTKVRAHYSYPYPIVQPYPLYTIITFFSFIILPKSKKLAMTVIIHRVGRIATRRSFQRQHQVFSPASKRQKSRAVEKGAKDVNAQSSVEEAKTIPRPDIVPSVPLWQRLGLLSKAFKAYGKAQRENPYTTQVCSSLVIYFCGDLSAQNIGGEKYDLLRTGRNMVIGGICSIPAYKWCVGTGQML